MSVEWRRWARIIRTPSCWSPNHGYDEDWDQALRGLMTKYRFRGRDGYKATLGPIAIWIANHPYASMRPFPELPHIRPSRVTILEAMDKLERECPERTPEWKQQLRDAGERVR